MTGSALFFVVLGVAVVVVYLMRLVLWLDTPRHAARRVRRSSPARHAADVSVAELGLERARLAA